MTDTIAASVFRHVLADVKQQGGAVSENHGHLLSTLSAENLQLFQAASELVDRKAVKKVTALPSKRAFFRVESLNRYHHQQQHVSDVSQPFDSSAVGGNGPNYYNCFDHYCSCSAFHLTAVTTPSAMASGDLYATSQAVPMTIQDADFAKMLCPQLIE